MNGFKKIDAHGYEGIVRSDCDKLVGAWLEQAKVLKSGPTRDVLVIEGPPKLFAKRFRGLVTGTARAHQEFEHLAFARDKRLDVPAPVALLDGREDSILVTEDVGPAVVLKSLLAGRGLDVEEKRRMTADLVSFFRQLREHGISHPELHVGQVSWAKGRTILMDMNRVQIFPRPLQLRELIPTIASFVFSITPFTTLTDRLRLLKQLGLAKDDWRQIVDRWRRMNRRYALARAQRSLISGGEFVEERVGEDSVYRRVEFTQVNESLNQLERGEVLKRQPRKTLLRLPNGLLARVIEYKGLRGAARRVLTGDEAMRAWYNSALLLSRGIHTPKLLALIVGRNRSILLREWIEDAVTLTDYASKTSDRKQAAFLLALAVRKLHEYGFLHKDLKPNNVLVREHADGRPEFYFIDLDRLEIGDSVPPKGRMLNLAQLNAGLGPPVTLGDRMHFYLSYAGWSKEWHEKRAEYIKHIMGVTRKRRHRWPPV
jgi:tRNA A-37 threonylcarbamoyl transferase component Bud32